MRQLILLAAGSLLFATPSTAAGDQCSAPTIVAVSGETTVGTDGDDVIEAGNGDDIVCGLDGDDRLNGGDGSDRLFGGEGIDLLDGGRGDDALRGGPGRDVFDAGPADDARAVDRCYGGSGRDVETGDRVCNDVASVELLLASSLEFGGRRGACADEPAVTYFLDGSVTILVSCNDRVAGATHFDSAEGWDGVGPPSDSVPEDDAQLDPNP